MRKEGRRSIRMHPTVILLLTGIFFGHHDSYGESQLRPRPEIMKEFKYPNSPVEGQEPVETVAMVPSNISSLAGYTELLPYILPSPYQDEAGSCLYMSLAGIAEWWLSRLNPIVSQTPNGPIDLSERHLMNVAGIEESDNGTMNWKTDSILLYNKIKHGILNRFYPFTKGYYFREKGKDLMPASREDSNAHYGTSYNWIPMLDQIRDGGKISLPSFERTVIFADPESNQWNTGIAPVNIVAKVKHYLQTYKAPILVIYNHYGYWHANFIVGFDDQTPHQCPFVRDFIVYMKKQAKKYRSLARSIGSRPMDQHPDYSRLADKYERFALKAERNFISAKGCSQKGVFYVRDSLYRDSEGPIYDYDSTNRGDEARYSKKVIMREYDWLSHLSNHVVQIHAVH